MTVLGYPHGDRPGDDYPPKPRAIPILEKTETEKFLDRLAELSHQNVQLACAKNADYANHGNPFGNFTLCEKLGICPTEVGMMARMTDKIARISNLLHREAAVKDESILDALSDLANYALILRIWLEWQQPQN